MRLKSSACCRRQRRRASGLREDVKTGGKCAGDLSLLVQTRAVGGGELEQKKLPEKPAVFFALQQFDL